MEKKKSDIRKEKLNIRNKLSADEVNILSARIFNSLINMPEYKDCENILVYSSIKNEVETKLITQNAFATQKKVYYPKVKDDQMEFYKTNSMDELFAGYMGILEPTNTNERFEDDDKSIIIIPLSVFDRNGNRIGYGGGFYDKYLARYTNLIKIAVAYSFQEYSSIHVESTDIKMDYIITENEIIEV